MYIVKFKYYQYNSGRGDNGTYDGLAKFKTLNEAVEFRDKVQNYLESKEISDEEREWKDDFLMSYVSYAGYFVSVENVYNITERITKVY